MQSCVLPQASLPRRSWRKVPFLGLLKHSVSSLLFKLIRTNRLFYGDLTLAADLRKHGFTGDLPLSFRSEGDLVKHLDDWSATHGEDALPGAVLFHSQYMNKERAYLKPLYFASTSQRVRVQRFQISQKYMGWLIKDSDGSCVYVKPADSNGATWRGYYAWLGENKAFSSEVIAATRRGKAAGESKGQEDSDLGNIEDGKSYAIQL